MSEPDICGYREPQGESEIDAMDLRDLLELRTIGPIISKALTAAREQGRREGVQEYLSKEGWHKEQVRREENEACIARIRSWRWNDKKEGLIAAIRSRMEKEK